MEGISSQNAPHELPTERADLRTRGSEPKPTCQVVVDNSVKVAVVHDIVHMAVLVIVLSPRLDG